MVFISITATPHAATTPHSRAVCGSPARFDAFHGRRHRTSSNEANPTRYQTAYSGSSWVNASLATNVAAYINMASATTIRNTGMRFNTPKITCFTHTTLSPVRPAPRGWTRYA